MGGGWKKKKEVISKERFLKILFADIIRRSNLILVNVFLTLSKHSRSLLVQY
jgi:hypothetical protein